MINKYLKQCAFGVLVILLVLLAVATVIEKIYGQEAAFAHIYHAWYFVALWGILGITALIYIIRLSLYWQKSSFLLHVAFSIILLGAFITFLTAERGYIHVRQGETVNHYILDDDYGSERELPFNVKLVLFDIEYHPGTYEPADYISFLKVDTAICKVSMNKIYKNKGYRIYQYSYDPDEMGTTLLVNHDPWGTTITYLGYLLLAMAMACLLWLRVGWKGVIYTIIPVVAVWFYISQLNPMTPVLRSPMLAAHVSVIMIAYALFVFITVTSIIALFSFKRRESLFRLNSKLLYPALFLLTAGIFIGAIWANISWGRYWGWDAKETWALITMLIYALPMHKRSIAIFRNPFKFHLYCVVAFLTIVMTFFGVTYILGGIHSYV